MKVGVNIMTLGVHPTYVLHNFLQLIILTWKTDEIVSFERHYHYH